MTKNESMPTILTKYSTVQNYSLWRDFTQGMKKIARNACLAEEIKSNETNMSFMISELNTINNN